MLRLRGQLLSPDFAAQRGPDGGLATVGLPQLQGR